MHTKIGTSAVVTLLIAATVTGCADDAATSPASASASGEDCIDGPVTVGYIPKLGTDPYMTTVRDGAKRAAEEIGGEVIYTEPSEATGAAQIPFVNQLVSQGVDVIAISGSDLNSAAAALQQARDAGIEVISFDSDVATEARSLFISQAETAELGEKMLDSMADLIGGSGSFAVLSSTPTAVNQNAWIASMKERLETDPAFAEMDLVDVVYGEEKADVNARKARELAQTYPDLAGIIVPAGIGLPAAARALSQTGDLGRIKMTGLAPPTLIDEYIQSGDVEDIWWDVEALGYLSFFAANALASCEVDAEPGATLSGGELGEFTVGKDGVVILGPAEVVTPQNLDDFDF